jgi:4-amino-4-deoxy-L-arabinose transferase-like glycosyltransferase
VLALALTVWALVPVFTDSARPLSQQPFPDSYEYADAAWQLAHGHGYVTVVNEHTGRFGRVARPPRFPFGTSIVLAPFAALIDGFPHGVQVGARVISVAYVIVVVWAAWALGGALAGALAALMLLLSPFAHESATLIMSDALGATLAVAPLIALSRHSTGRAAAAVAGALAGAGVCVRFASVIALPAVALAARRGKRWIIALACAAPFAIALGLYQWLTFGSPLRTGYWYWLPHLHTWSLSFIFDRTTLVEGPFVYTDRLNGSLLSSICPCPVGGSMSALRNIAFYPAVLAGLFWVFAPPLTGLIGLAMALRERVTPAAQYALVTVVLNVALMLVYFTQAARFVAPAASVLLVYSAVGVAGAVRWALRSSMNARSSWSGEDGSEATVSPA